MTLATSAVRLHLRPVPASVVLCAAIVGTFLTTKDYFPDAVRVSLPGVLAAVIVIRQPVARFWLMLAVTVALALTVAVNREVIANHGYMLLYAAAGLTLALSVEGEESEEVWRTCCQWLLGMLMGIALVQKLTSAHYMGGNLVGSLILEGEAYAAAIASFRPGWPEDVAAFGAAMDAARAGGPDATVALSVPEPIRWLAVGLTWVSLAAQTGLEVLLILRRRVGMLLHVGLLGFVMMIYITRPENVFLSVNCLLGLGLTDARTQAARPWYLAAAAFLLLSQLVGWRPALLN